MTRISAIHLLGNYLEPQVIQYFIWLLQNGDHWDRNAVTHAFTKIGGTEAVDALIANLPFETDPNNLVNYSYAFAELGDKRAVPMLEALLERIDPIHRSMIETNLRALNPPSPKPANLLTRLKSHLQPHS
jgi:HEAT repeat protein